MARYWFIDRYLTVGGISKVHSCLCPPLQWRIFQINKLYAPIELDKPIILIFLGDEYVLDIRKEECSQHCNSDKVETILWRLLADYEDTKSIHGPIQWLNEGSFSASALGRIYHRISLYLPYYIKYNNGLEQGVIVPGTMGPVPLYNTINILVLEDDIGCLEFVDEIKSIVLSQHESNLIFV